MRKLPNIAATVLAATLIYAGTAAAQQTPASTSSPATAKKPAGTTAKVHSSGTAGRAPLVLKTDKEKQSYAIGLSLGENIGKNIHKDDVDVDTNILLRGVRDGLVGGKTSLTAEEAQAVLQSLEAGVQKKREEKMALAGETNKKAGDDFLAANKTKDGVVALPSGLQYKVLTEGTGPKPTAEDTVICNYKGTLLDGTEFDSSYKRNQPATFSVGQVIKGWTEALQLMPVGSKWDLFVPAELAYGPRGNGPIGPNSTLIFEVELLSIQPKK
ncbi:MAG: FKBP-type peptidyl-prolyl cis-trans isomerase [Candidatus Acidiferrales bacterium]